MTGKEREVLERAYVAQLQCKENRIRELEAALAAREEEEGEGYEAARARLGMNMTPKERVMFRSVWNAALAAREDTERPDERRDPALAIVEGLLRVVRGGVSGSDAATDVEAAELFLAHRERPHGHRAGDLKKGDRTYSRGDWWTIVGTREKNGYVTITAESSDGKFSSSHTFTVDHRFAYVLPPLAVRDTDEGGECRVCYGADPDCIVCTQAQMEDGQRAAAEELARSEDTERPDRQTKEQAAFDAVRDLLGQEVVSPVTKEPIGKEQILLEPRWVRFAHKVVTVVLHAMDGPHTVRRPTHAPGAYIPDDEPDESPVRDTERPDESRMNRALAYRYLYLPVTRRREIAEELGLSDVNVGDPLEVFKAARDRDLIARLTDLTDEHNGIPDSYWREVPCGHPPDPVALRNKQGNAVCHCGQLLDGVETLPDMPFGAPGPIVPCKKCGCYVAVPDVRDPEKKPNTTTSKHEHAGDER